MNEITLRKNKMKRRKVKLADLIKLLRARPKNKQLEKLYKAIIENTKEASLKDKENIVSIKSSTKLTEEEKKEVIDENLENMPLNQIIRNLKFLADKYDFNKNIDLQKRIVEKLSKIEDYRKLNIFDIIMASMFVPKFEKALFEVIKKFVERTREEFTFPEDSTVLFDVSGSMGSRGNMKDGKGLGFQYLVLFALLMKKLKLRTFSDNLNSDELTLNKVIKNIQDGCIGDAYKLFENHFESHSGGTALLESAQDLLQKEPEIKNLIVVTDEVSWEKQNLIGDISELSKKLNNRNLIIINPVIYNGTVFDKNVAAISSLNPSVLMDMAIFLDEAGFIKYIKNYKATKSQDQANPKTKGVAKKKIK